MLYEIKNLKFSEEEIDVFLKFLADVMIIDNHIHYAESSFFSSVLKALEFNPNKLKKAIFKMPLVKAISIARKMKKTKKNC